MNPLPLQENMPDEQIEMVVRILAALNPEFDTDDEHHQETLCGILDLLGIPILSELIITIRRANAETPKPANQSREEPQQQA